MTLVREIVTDAAIGVGVADTPEGLSALHRPGCAAAIWRRQPLPSFQSWIDGLDAERLPKARVILRPDAVRAAASEICDLSGTPDCPERDRLVDDIAALADIFATLMRARWLRLRLDVVTTNACRRFHIDAVTARLVCTYRGTGTQYAISTDGAEPQRIFTVPTGAPILLRGTLWPESPRAGLLHRSPPIEGTGATRLVLVLDPIDDPEEAV
ncbi:hypothetical protein FIU97_18690 (plasmid) [Roseivivax sp. THAF40]|uniref:DUF1826 domain-containing protein n=1 Tax=unclassified Roseivivax TaxID=2639302 RepID=UPI00126801B3|nr:MULTISPECIES: DUF1826 domain-containing protein [unclassified Roseivivax]QFS84919.1 hypothetical protein FIV09_18910 [Roseivivax sp. THAF197b]QFT48620.1 hypothetical protein FIU97_18690 [Roseivivax sp. THAF40]